MRDRDLDLDSVIISATVPGQLCVVEETGVPGKTDA